MHRVTCPDDFAARVDYAARVIAEGRETSRAFDGCFEMSDGELVVAALMRRAVKNERLRLNLPRYLVAHLCEEEAARYAHVPTRLLAEEARKARGASEAAWQARVTERHREEAARSECPA